MSPVTAEKFLMFVEKSPVQSGNDPLTIIPPNPEDPEGFQPLLFRSAVGQGNLEVRNQEISNFQIWK